jgi:hypothetical protein
MAAYCQAGDTARVTFPDGSIQDFTNTPISISVLPEYERYSLVTVQFRVFLNNYAFFGTHTERLRVPFGGIRQSPVRPGLIQALCHGFYDFMSPQEPQYWQDIVDYSQFSVSEIAILSVTYDPIKFLGYRFLILDFTEVEIWNQLYSTDNYSVECIQGCPANTLDCGDCCLPCDEIFNSISDIRRLISRIR